MKILPKRIIWATVITLTLFIIGIVIYSAYPAEDGSRNNTFLMMLSMMFLVAYLRGQIDNTSLFVPKEPLSFPQVLAAMRLLILALILICLPILLTTINAFQYDDSPIFKILGIVFLIFALTFILFQIRIYMQKKSSGTRP